MNQFVRGGCYDPIRERRGRLQGGRKRIHIKYESEGSAEERTDPKGHHSSLHLDEPDRGTQTTMKSSEIHPALFKRLCLSNCNKWAREVFQKHGEGVEIVEAASASQLPQ